MVTRNKFWTVAAVGSLLFSMQASAAEIERNTAQMQAMDKITGRVSVIDVPVNSEVAFGSFPLWCAPAKRRLRKKRPKTMRLLTWLTVRLAKCNLTFSRGG